VLNGQIRGKKKGACRPEGEDKRHFSEKVTPEILKEQ
jgi:hypothetical protein